MQQESSASWWNNLIAGLSQKQAAPPPSPEPPAVDEGAWEQSVDQAQISPNLSVHNLGLIVFDETQSYSDRPDSNEPIDAAREKLAHVVINGDQKWGAERQKNASTALPIEPSPNALRNSNVRAAYDSSMRAAREAYLSGSDPTNGAPYLNQRTNPDRSNRISQRGSSQGVPLSTQSGPYHNSFPNKEVPSGTVWLNTFHSK